MAQEPSDELRSLAAIIADWAHEDSTVHLFGSRVRGDHKPDSDVDVVIVFSRPTDELVRWWTAVNEGSFASINASLPGPLAILELDDPFTQQVIAAATNAFHRDRNVNCVWLPPKPGTCATPR